MSKTNIIILVLVAVGVAAALGFRSLPETASEPATDTAAEALTVTAEKLPRMIEFGSDKCASCQAMMPVLDEVRRDNVGTLLVDFVDVWKDPDTANQHGIQTIPTQVFFDAEGKEIFRHKGFFSADKIRERWVALGYDVKKGKSS